MKWPEPLLIIILLPLYFLSCDSKPYPQVLQLADSLANTCPDSAIVLLEQFKNSASQESKETQMYYQLLTIKAKDKAYITHTSDSLILEVLHYYEKRKDKKHLPEAYYYAGRIYRDLGDAPQALDYFFKAIDAFSNYNRNNKLMSRIYSQIGTLYLYQEVYDKAPDVFDKAYKCNILARDSIGMTYNLRDIGRAFSTQQQIDSAIHYYKKANLLAEKIQNKHLKCIVNNELSGYYSKLGMYQEAYQTMQIASSLVKPQNRPAQYTVSARYYYHIGQLDSAAYYYSKLLLVNNCLYKQGGYQGLANIARYKGEYKKALSYFDKYIVYSDSVQDITQSEVIRKIHALYNYQYKEKENNRLQHLANNYQIWNIIFISFFISLTLIFAVYWQYHKRKKQEELAQQRRIKRMQEEQYNQSLACIEENRRQIKKLEQSLQSAEIIKSSLNQDLLNLQKKLIEKSNEQIIAKQEFREQGISILKKSPIYHKFLEAEQGIKIKKEDWQELTHSINEAYTDFTLRLLDLYPMKTIEMQVCLLIKIGVPPTQIAYITSHTKQAITSIRKRLYKKVFNMDGSPEDWDIFINSM